MKTLGALIRECREKHDWPQRKLAHALDIDVAVLSRIENENRFPKKRVTEIISVISRLFGIPQSELRVVYFSDEIAGILKDEGDFENILKASEAKVRYIKRQSKGKEWLQ